MKCPHCTVSFFENWNQIRMQRQNYLDWWYRTALCPSCKQLIIQITSDKNDEGAPTDWKLFFPSGGSRGPVPISVPNEIAEDYIEACNVMPISPKASAALSRRCLQNILHAHGYTARNLALEIDALLSEPDTTKAIPTNLRLTIDGIRNFGNFSAHPTEDVATSTIIDVEPHEAEWCLEILEDMFEHFYVRPAEALIRKAALDAKLIAAGKTTSK